jgi:hypothetical protein
VRVWSSVRENNIHSKVFRGNVLSGKFDTNYRTQVLTKQNQIHFLIKYKESKKGLG